MLHKNTSLILFLSLVITATLGVRPIFAADDGPADISGTTITILGAMDAGQLERSFAAFEQETGAKVIYTQGQPQTEIWDMLEGEEIPDVVIFPQPGVARKLADEGQIIDLNTILDQDFLAENYKPDWIEIGTYNDQLIGLFFNANVKSLVWYPVNAFQRAGYKIPGTWDELIALSDQMVSDGKTPWCIGFEGGEWVITDWLEDIMLRLHGAETYDRWVNGDLPFNSPEVTKAVEMMAEVFFTENYVLGGQEGLANTNWMESMQGIIADPPDCFMHRQGSFLSYFLPPELVVGRDVDFFYLPPMGVQFDESGDTSDEADNQSKPLLIGGDMVTMFQDRPEVRAFVKYIATAESVRPMINQGGVVSPHIGQAIDWYPTYSDREYAQMIMDADIIRFDGSDMMPDEVGNNAFWGWMYAYVSGGDLDEALQMIDESWPK